MLVIHTTLHPDRMLQLRLRERWRGNLHSSLLHQAALQIEAKIFSNQKLICCLRLLLTKPPRWPAGTSLQPFSTYAQTSVWSRLQKWHDVKLIHCTGSIVWGINSNTDSHIYALLVSVLDWFTFDSSVMWRRNCNLKRWHEMGEETWGGMRGKIITRCWCLYIINWWCRDCMQSIHIKQLRELRGDVAMCISGV